MNKLKARISELSAKIQKYNFHYYNLDQSLVTDEEYDLLLKELSNLELKDKNLLKHNSPTQSVGSEISDDKLTYEHLFPMLSLSNSMNIDDVRDFILKIHNDFDKKIKFTCELKFDGLALSLIYTNGNLIRAVTRGNGITGEDVTNAALAISAIPKKIEFNSNIIDVRGEVIMPKKNFENLNSSTNEKKFSNPRNAASGTLRLLDSEIIKSRGLDFYAYSSNINYFNNLKNHSLNLDWLTTQGFKISNPLKIISNIDEFREFSQKLEKNRNNFPFEIDGIVIKVDNFDFHSRIGAVARNPKWATSYKFPAIEKKTKLNNITYQVGRTGVVTPIAILEPVKISGVTISRCTLHNFKELEKKDIRINDFVFVRRAGDVIPEITIPIIENDLKRSNKFIPPTNCPSCKEELVTENVFLVCPNKYSCPDQVSGSIIHFCSKDALNIEGLGDETILLLIKKDLIKSAYDIFRLKYEDLINLPKMGDKSVKKLLASIDSSKNCELARFIYALGIKNVGKNISNILANKCKSMDMFLRLQYDDLIDTKDIGPLVAESIIKYISLDINIELVNNLLKIGIIPKFSESAVSHGYLNGNLYAVTGKFGQVSRVELVKIIEKNGGKFSSNLTQKTDVLIYGENTSSKMDKAKKFNIKMIEFNEFIKDSE